MYNSHNNLRFFRIESKPVYQSNPKHKPQALIVRFFFKLKAALMCDCNLAWAEPLVGQGIKILF